MGSTVTTGRMAAAFHAPSGAIIYCLYEQTYEKNCYPHTPHWSAIYIGQITGALQKVFSYASACEGGMLQNRSGRITPEGYLRSWMSELQAPVLMTRDHNIDLYVKTGCLHAPLLQDSMPAVAASLTAAGLEDAARILQAGEKVTLSLFKHADLISLLVEKHRLSVWRLLPADTRPHSEAERYTSLGIPAAKAKLDKPDYPPALIVSRHGDMILRDADGAWRCKGWRHEIMASYIENLAAVEQAHPGNYRHLIQSYREHLNAAPKANPEHLTVQVDKVLVTNKWEIQKIEEAAALPGAVTHGSIITIPFSTEHDYSLAHLPRAATTWRVLNENSFLSKSSRAPQASFV